MARKTIKVDIPKGKPDAFVKLNKSVIEKHEADPAASKADPADVAALKILYLKGIELRDKSIAARKQSESLMEEANKALGIGKGQSNTTEGTALYYLVGIRDSLLKAHRNNEEKLSEYGFNVVVGQAKSPTKKPK